jgi:taspase (threonine aspartase 1)
MLILKNGGSALDAVEAAIKTLEDREITNAGYGSNLAMDGVVECDAAVVDHLGRSGAVGAVARRRQSCHTPRCADQFSRDQKPHLVGPPGA